VQPKALYKIQGGVAQRCLAGAVVFSQVRRAEQKHRSGRRTKVVKYVQMWFSDGVVTERGAMRLHVSAFGSISKPVILDR
jgi:hypothetical protein